MIIITGASDGLGKELAKLFVADGKKVVGLSRSKCSYGVEHIYIDLRDVSSIQDTAAKINSKDERIEALINCAGVLSIEKMGTLTVSEVDKVMDTNIRAPLLLTSALMDRIKRDGADIVNISSTVGTKAYPSQAAYGSSKWAIRGFSANLQLELKDTPCRVVSFCSGGFVSKFSEKASGGTGIINENEWMRAKDVAILIKQILELPKSMEVSEIVLNRKIIR